MKKYWIIVDGKPVGPFTKSELKFREDFRGDLPVWTAELTDWTTVENLPELACMLPINEEKKDEESAAPPIPEEEQPTPQPQPIFGSQIPPQSAWINPQPAVSVNEPRPNSYIGWNILMLICCSPIVGILGIVFGSQVNLRWMRGDVEGAKKYSEMAAWCLIISIVLGLVSIPFQIALAL